MGADDPYVLGIDLGTESARAGIFDPEGRAVATAATGYGLTRRGRPRGRGGADAEPGPSEVLIRVGANTICATDVRILRGEKTSGVSPVHARARRRRRRRLPVRRPRGPAVRAARARRAPRRGGRRAVVVARRARRGRARHGRRSDRAPAPAARAPQRRARGRRRRAFGRAARGGRAAGSERRGRAGRRRRRGRRGHGRARRRRRDRLHRRPGPRGRGDPARAPRRPVNAFAGFPKGITAEIDPQRRALPGRPSSSGSANSRRRDYQTPLRLIEVGRIDTAQGPLDRLAQIRGDGEAAVAL
jgi:hypothetical protein